MRAPILKNGLVVAAVGSLLLLAPPASPGIDIQMRLSGGLLRMDLGEVNSALFGWRDGLKRTADPDPTQQYVSGELIPLHFGIDFEAELLFSFSRWFKLGLSTGYAYASFNEEAALLIFEQAGVLYDRARPTKVSAFPLLVSGYFNVPLGKKFGVYLRAGAGGIQARYISRTALRKVGDERFSYTAYDNAKAVGLTYLGGLGLSYSFDQSLGFFVEAVARSARVDGLSGENRLEETGTLYSYEEYLPKADFWQPSMHVFPAEPAGVNIRNVRKATVDFGGYSIKIGLLMKF